MSEMRNKLQDTTIILSLLAITVIVGIVWLVLFGNLSTATSFGRQSSTYVNQTITLSNGGATPAGASGVVNGNISAFVVTNASSGGTVPTTNYTISGITVRNAANNPGAYNGSSVNITYTVTYDSAGLVDTNSVIQNGTLGFTTFFGNMPTIFQIAAVVLLITMVVGLLFLIISVVKKLNSSDGFGSSGSFNGYD